MQAQRAPVARLGLLEGQADAWPCTSAVSASLPRFSARPAHELRQAESGRLPPRLVRGPADREHPLATSRLLDIARENHADDH